MPDPANSSGDPVNAAGLRANGPSDMMCEATRLMTLAKHGDREAFDRLVVSLRGRAFHLARGFVGSREDALELSQEALLKVYRARESYRDGEPFLPWFHRILRNTCFSFLRKQGRLRKRSLTTGVEGEELDQWEIVDEDTPGPGEHLEGQERAQLFWRAFRELGDRDREILSLRHFDELAYQEIAETLEIPIGTVMSRLYHARRRLREGVGPLLEESPGETIGDSEK
jgi:RNA polymerase sigma-70 factor (ECF subfamily)